MRGSDTPRIVRNPCTLRCVIPLTGAALALWPRPAGRPVLFRRSAVVELVVFAALAFAALVVIGVLISVFSVVGWFLWLPFKIIGWALKLVGLLFALPFILIACVIGGFAVLMGTGFLLVPLFPLLLLAGVVWLFFRPRRPNSTQARFVS